MRPIAALTMAMSFLAGHSANAQTTAPDYYIEALFAVSTAEQLANFCPRVGLDLQATNEASEALLVRLREDGIEGDAILALGGVEAGVVELQDAFVETHGLSQPTEELLCDAAAAEIADGTVVGQYLTKAAQ